MNRNRTVSLITAACAVFALAGCGGGDDDAAAESSEQPAAEQQTDQSEAAPESPSASASAEPEAESAAAEPAGDADCTSLTDDDIAQYMIATQLLAQTSTADQVVTLRDQLFGNYSPEQFAAVLVKLRALVGGQGDDMFGDPDEALDSWEEANAQMTAMMAAADPTPQAMLDDYIALGDVATKIGWQLPINAPLSEICPDLG